MSSVAQWWEFETAGAPEVGRQAIKVRLFISAEQAEALVDAMKNLYVTVNKRWETEGDRRAFRFAVISARGSGVVGMRVRLMEPYEMVGLCGVNRGGMEMLV
jgi:hypothetical protein